MPDIFNSIFDYAAGGITVLNFLVCIASALVLGCVMTFAQAFKRRCSRSFMLTLALLPSVVSVVIMLVNGNIGAGVAVAGAFGLIRFRSAPGTAREIIAIFISTCTGLLIGMGYIGYGALFTLVMGAVIFLFDMFGKSGGRAQTREKTLRISIPEDLNYSDVFEDIFKEYAEYVEPVSVKTANMGSIYKLKYNIVLKDPLREKQFIDELRCRNGNLEISICNREEMHNEL